MARYTVYYTIKLDGEITINASSEEEAREWVEDMSDADLVEDVEFGSGEVRVVDVRADDSALEQLAGQAES